MALFYFNHDNNRADIDSYFEKIGAERKWSVDDAKQCTENDLIFVHLAEKRDEWCKLGNGDVYVVFMSTDIHTLQPAGLNDYVHNCEFPADRLTEYPQIEKFIKGFSSSHQWDLLKRPLFPETLAAAYLLMIAKGNGIDVPLDSLTEAQWKEAYGRYEEIGGVDADWKGALGGDKEKIGAVKGKIGDLFSPAASQTR